jgi:hypothetical protein
MSDLEETYSEPPTDLEETNNEPSMGGVQFYGIVADSMILLPILFYMLFDKNGYAKHHQTMINMITSSYMPFAIVWLIVKFQNTATSRKALEGALEMAALGPFALMWVGYMAFLMSAQASDVLGQGANVLWAILYPCINIGLIIFHWTMSPKVYDFIDGDHTSDEVEELEGVVPIEDISTEQ